MTSGGLWPACWSTFAARAPDGLASVWVADGMGAVWQATPGVRVRLRISYDVCQLGHHQSGP
jgi:hypothetical protein